MTNSVPFNSDPAFGGPIDDDRIAVVGMSCLFPGAPDVSTYWSNILGSVDSVTGPVSPTWREDYYDPEFADSDSIYCEKGGYIGGIATFDPLRYGIPPKSVSGEPDQWLALKVAVEALEDAGAIDLDPDRRRKTGIVLGKGTYLNGGNAVAVQRTFMLRQMLRVIRKLHPEFSVEQMADLKAALMQEMPDINPETVAALIPNVTVGRIANRLDFMGPAYTVDGACSSSLLALQAAKRHLLEGECDVVLAGGSQVWIPSPTQNLFCRIRALSPTETIRPFDENADGTLLGEGIGMVVLKRLADAERDDDRIYAVIRGLGVASDGKGLGVMAPRVEGEIQALERAYADAGVDPSTIELVEAHGTGTVVGDATEIEALTRLFGERTSNFPGVAVGTVKSQISHTIPAAGIAGLIKVALALHHKVLPPTINCERPHEGIRENPTTPLYVNAQARPWVHAGEEPRRAGINAFGFGGINTHAVVEEYTGTSGNRRDHLPAWESEVVVLEAADPQALAAKARELADKIEQSDHGLVLTDLAAALAAELGPDTSAMGGARVAIVTPSLDELTTKLHKAADRLESDSGKRIKGAAGIFYEPTPLAVGPDQKVALMFPGEGSQYVGMLQDLCLYFPEVREVFDFVDSVAAPTRNDVTSDWVFPRAAFTDDERAAQEANLQRMDVAVEAVMAANQAALALINKFEIDWDLCLGHSTGENSAAVAAGVVPADEDNLTRFCREMYASWTGAEARSDVAKAVLFAVGSDRASVESVIANSGATFQVAMDNCPHQTILAGPSEDGPKVRAELENQGLIFEELPFDRAVHTPHFETYAELLRPVFESVGLRTPERPLWSCTHSAPCPDDPAEILDLFVEHWVAPVEFVRTIERLHRDEGVNLFIECGARGNLTAFVDDILRGEEYCAVPVDTQRRTGIGQLNRLFAQLLVHGVSFNIAEVFRGRTGDQLKLADLPVETKPVRSMEAPLLTSFSEMALLEIPPSIAASLAAGPSMVAANSPSVSEAASSSSPASSSPSASATDVAPAPPAQLEPNVAVSPAQPELVAPVPVDPQPVSVQPVSGPNPMAAQVLEAHFARMSQMLDMHSALAQAQFNPTAPAMPLPVADAAPVSLPAPANTEGAPATAPSAQISAGTQPSKVQPLAVHPWLGRVVSHTPGKSLATEGSLSADLPALDQHRIGGVLPVMPLALSAALMAQAAVELVPGNVVRSLVDLHGSRWLTVEDDVGSTYRITAEVLGCENGETRVKATMVAADGPDLTAATDVAWVEVVVAPETNPTSEQPQVAPELEATSILSPEQLYGDVLFHGEAWQGVTGITASGRTTILASMRMLDTAKLSAGAWTQPLAVDPIALDAAGQLIGFWTCEQLDRARVVFPYYMARLDLFGSAPALGTELTGQATIDCDPQLVHSDIEVLRPDGTVWMRLSRWADRRFDLPTALEALVGAPGAAKSMSDRWEPMQLPEDVVLRRLDVSPAVQQPLWLEIWQMLLLDRAERNELGGAQLPPKRRAVRLAARTAAKEAVAAQDGSGELARADVSIIKSDLGRPEVRIRSGATDRSPSVSLSNSGRTGVAAVRSQGPVGVDIEEVDEMEGAVLRTSFTDDEIAVISAAAGPNWALRSWSAKEAVGKALGTGLPKGPRGVVIQRIDDRTGRIFLTLGEDLASAFPNLAGSSLYADTAVDGGIVVAVTTCAKETAK